jgi:hypothetical protein
MNWVFHKAESAIFERRRRGMFVEPAQKIPKLRQERPIPDYAALTELDFLLPSPIFAPTALLTDCITIKCDFWFLGSEGTIENSPAVHCRVNGGSGPVPKGRLIPH